MLVVNLDQSRLPGVEQQGFVVIYLVAFYQLGDAVREKAEVNNVLVTTGQGNFGNDAKVLSDLAGMKLYRWMFSGGAKAANAADALTADCTLEVFQ